MEIHARVAGIETLERKKAPVECRNSGRSLRYSNEAPFLGGRMAKGGVSLDSSNRGILDAGHVSRLVYVECYLNTASIRREVSSFGQNLTISISAI